jgi:hypothetical protein
MLLRVCLSFFFLPERSKEQKQELSHISDNTVQYMAIDNRLVILIADDMLVRLMAHKDHTGCSVSEFVRRAILAALNEAEKSKQ